MTLSRRRAAWSRSPGAVPALFVPNTKTAKCFFEFFTANRVTIFVTMMPCVEYDWLEEEGQVKVLAELPQRSNLI